MQKAVAGGCHLTRDTPALVAAAGMAVDSLQQQHLGGTGDVETVDVCDVRARVLTASAGRSSGEALVGHPGPEPLQTDRLDQT